jgi:hypothetical protein
LGLSPLAAAGLGAAEPAGFTAAPLLPFLAGAAAFAGAFPLAGAASFAGAATLGLTGSSLSESRQANIDMAKCAFVWKTDSLQTLLVDQQPLQQPMNKGKET